MGFNPMQGRSPKTADLVMFFTAIAAIAVAVIWALS